LGAAITASSESGHGHGVASLLKQPSEDFGEYRMKIEIEEALMHGR
jgi:hypothetical protein